MKRYWTLLVLTLVYAVSLVDRSVIGILLESIRLEMRVSDTVMGLVTGFGFSIVYGLASIPFAYLADHGIRRNIVATGLFVFSLATSLSGLAANILHVLIGRFFVAAGEATQLAPSVSMLADGFPRRQRARAMAIFGTGPSLGIIFGLSAAGFLNAEYGWRVTLMVLGAPGILLALLVRFTVPEPERITSGGLPAGDKGAHSLRSTIEYLFGRRSFCLLLVATVLNAWPLFGTTLWGPAFVGRVHQFDSAQTGLLFGLVYGVLGLVGALAGGFVSDFVGARHEQRKLLFPALAAGIVCPALLCFLLAESTWLVVGALGVAAFMANAQMGPVWAVMQSVSPVRMRATAAACFQLLINLFGLGLGPFLIGFLNDLFTAEFGGFAIRRSMLLLPMAALGSSIALYLASRAVEHDMAFAEKQAA